MHNVFGYGLHYCSGVLFKLMRMWLANTNSFISFGSPGNNYQGNVSMFLEKLLKAFNLELKRILNVLLTRSSWGALNPQISEIKTPQKGWNFEPSQHNSLAASTMASVRSKCVIPNFSRRGWKNKQKNSA